MQQTSSYRQYIPAIAVATVLYALFAILSFMVAYGVPDATDYQIEQAVYALRSPGLNTLIETITYCGNTSTIIVVTLLLLAYPKTRYRYGLPVFAAATLTTVIKVIVKNLIERPRPDQMYFLIEQGGFSYPSGHAITSLAVYGILAWLIWYYHKVDKESQSAVGTTPAGVTASAAGMPGRNKALLILCAFLAVAVGLSRVYVGVHHPTDILGGFLAGSATAILVAAAVVQIVHKGGIAAIRGKSQAASSEVAENAAAPETAENAAAPETVENAAPSDAATDAEGGQ